MTVASVLGELRIFRTLVTVPVFSLITGAVVAVGVGSASEEGVLSESCRFRLGSVSGAATFCLHPENRAAISIRTSAMLKNLLSL